MLLGCCACLPTASAASESAALDLRLQIVWGGSDARLWRGSIYVPGGRISDIRLLGLDADQPGSFVHRNDRVLVEPRFGANYSGFEASVAGPGDAELHISLATDRDGNTPEIRIPLVELREGEHRRDLDGHRLRVVRAPADDLRVRFQKENLVFSPGELIRLDIAPHELAVKAGSHMRARMRLRHAEDRRNELADFWEQDLWNRTELLRVDESGHVPPILGVEIPAPKEEGVYNLTIDLLPQRLPSSVTIPQIGTVGLPPLGHLSKRVVQLVVIDSRRPPLYGEGTASLVTEFDPADPKWFERLTQLPQWKLLPHVKRPWGNQQPEVWHDGDRSWSRLLERGWMAYSLPVRDPSVPHVLQVEFPPNLPQDVGIAILEPSSGGEYSLVGLDSGVTIGDPDLELPNVSAPSTSTRHRVVFWPKTSAPVLLISNRQAEGSIAFGRIRLESFRQGLPTFHLGAKAARQRIAMLDANRLKSIFLTPTVVNQKSRVIFDDWETFYQSAVRLAAYLRYAGYDGAALSVMGDGSALYPSRYLYATAEYDRGIFADTGQDPVRKDVLEMLFRVFDRENLTLIPTVEFATPLPELEKWLATGGVSAQGIELISAQGRPGSDRQRSRRAPYYNPINARVQQAMRRIVEEIVQRYAAHSSFGGLAIEFDDAGFTQFPDLEWGFDSATLDRFSQSLSHRQDIDAAQQIVLLRQQAVKRQSTPLTQQWLRWRAARLSQFYQQLSGILSTQDPADKLYLAMANLASSGPWQRHLRPALTRKSSVEQAMLELGLDAAALADGDHSILLRPHRLSPISHLTSQAVNLETLQPDVQKLFSKLFSTDAPMASQFLHESHPMRLDSFEQLGPPSARRPTTLETVFARAGMEARRPYARSLAQHDDQLMLDGGTVVPMGQEEATRSFFHVYRQLPPRPFQTLSFGEAAPLVVRVLSDDKQTFLYAVNPSPWPVTGNFRWKTTPDCVISALGQQQVETTQILGRTEADVTIEPYSLVAFRFSSPRVDVVRCQATLPAGIAKQLSIQLADVVARANQNRQKPEPVNLLKDGGFESKIAEAGDEAWTVSTQGQAVATNDFQIRARGDASLHLKSTGGQVVVLSHEFEAPDTGRLVMTMRLRASRPTVCPCVIGIQSTNSEYGRRFRFPQQLTSDFQEVVIPVSDLPIDPNMRLRMSVRMEQPGEVWVDDIRFFDKWFMPAQQEVLHRLLMVALENEDEGDFAACYEALRGYWPRFLLRHVPPVQVAVRSSPAMPTQTEPLPRVPDKQSFLDKVKKLMRLP